MFTRPNINETEKDLIVQELQSNSNPSVKLTNVQSNSKNEENQLCKRKSKSKFVDDCIQKKKKEGIVDNTVLKEAERHLTRDTPVLGKVVARDVLSLMPTLQAWHPLPCPEGYPIPPILDIYESDIAVELKQKSLYMNHIGNLIPEAEKYEEKKSIYVIKPLSVISGTKQLTKAEVEKIHQENIERLSKFTHEEIIQEREEILSHLSADKINFLKNFRKNKSKIETEICGAKITRSTITSEILEESNISGINNDKYTGNEQLLTEDKSLEEEKFPEDELPIPISEFNKFPNMDKVEYDKLKWMTDMPKLKPLKSAQGYIARFNFKGDLLPYDAVISWREGLHHHGSEPERAGYTVDELFIFIRSSFLQQRYLGLQVIGNILKNAKEGMYDECFETSIIQLMVDAGVVLLLRIALDDSSPSVFQEALRAIYYLISSEPDEECLSLYQLWAPLGISPGISSKIHASEKAQEELKIEESELRDIEIMQLDLVNGLIRIDILARIRFILESERPASPYVLYSLGILIRIAHHSLPAAWSIVNFPNLLNIVFKNFLPHDISPLFSEKSVSQMTSVYDVPLRQALYLFKVLARRGRHLASTLCSRFDVMSCILSYVSVEPTEIRVPIQEALLLSLEAYSLWSTLMSYSLTKPQEAFLTFYPCIIKQLLFYRDKVSVNEKQNQNKFNYDIGANLLHFIKTAFDVSAAHHITTQGSQVFPTILIWEDLVNAAELVETCFVKWITELIRSSDYGFSILRLIGTCCSFLCMYYKKWKYQETFCANQHIKAIENLYSKAIKSFLESTILERLCLQLINNSNLCSIVKSGNKRDSSNLDSLGFVTFGGKVVPIMKSLTPFPLLYQFSNLIWVLQNLCPTLHIQCTMNFSNNSIINNYFEAVCENTSSLASQWSTRTEIYFINNLLKLNAHRHINNKLFKKIAVKIIPLIQKPDKALLKTLLNDILYNGVYLETKVITEPLNSTALKESIIPVTSLINEVTSQLSKIAKDNGDYLVSRSEEKLWSDLNNAIPCLIDKLTYDISPSIFAFDEFWTMKPVRDLLANVREKNIVTSPDETLMVLKCLQLTFITLKSNNFSLEINRFGILRHLSLVFLLSTDIFLDVKINSYLQACFFEIVNIDQNKEIYDIEFSMLSSGYDWYKHLLKQYESVSYCDLTFSLYLLIPLQRHWPSKYKILLWQEHSDALPFILLNCSHVEKFMPLQQFLHPLEAESEVLKAYQSAITNKIINESKNAFLFKIAAHHLYKCG